MAWGRLDDAANGNAKLLALTDPAWRMWGCGLIYCQANLTDGFIPTHAVETFGVRARNKAAVVDELCRSLVPNKGPLWHRVDGGYQVHDYLDWNDDCETVTRNRSAAAERMARYRARLQEGRDRARVTRNESRHATDHHAPNERRSFVGSTSTTTPVPSEQGTAPAAPRASREAVTAPNVWTVAVAIAHAVCDAVTGSADRTEEFKVRCALQGIDYAAIGGDARRPLYARALEFVEQQRARRTA